MTFRFVTIQCCNCDKILGGHVITNLVDAQFFCPNCIVVIEELRYSLGIIDQQIVARALMNLYFHNFTKATMIHNIHSCLEIKMQSYGSWHVKMWIAVKQLCEKI